MNVVILAAGMGKRMQSALPKVLHPLAGKPLLRHVIDTARSLGPKKLCVIYGHGGAAVPEMVSALAQETGSVIETALQQPQLGTGHAVMQAVPQLDDADATLVLYGDVPLTTVDSLRRLVDAAGTDKLAILTVEQANPFGLGRIVRDDSGAIVRIVEEKDANEQERAIKEINSGIMVIPTRHLKKWLAALLPDRHRGAGSGRWRAGGLEPAVGRVGSGWRQQQGAVGRARAPSSTEHCQCAAGKRRDPDGSGAHRRTR